MSPDEIQVRRDICGDCTRNCGVRETLDHSDPCADCPLGVFGKHAECWHSQEPDQLRGLGDAVAVVTQPIARMIDAATGGRTNIAGCGGCKKRQAALNKIIPFI